jgi:hypothetical protein
MRPTAPTGDPDANNAVEDAFAAPIPKVIYTSRDFSPLGLSSRQKFVLLAMLSIGLFLLKTLVFDSAFESEDVWSTLRSAGEFSEGDHVIRAVAGTVQVIDEEDEEQEPHESHDSDEDSALEGGD